MFFAILLLIATTDATFITVGHRSRANLHRRYSLIDDIRGIGWSRTSRRKGNASSPSSDHLSSPILVEFQETKSELQPEPETEEISGVATIPFSVLDEEPSVGLPIVSEESEWGLPSEVAGKAIMIELKNGTELFPSSSVFFGENNLPSKDVSTLQLTNGVRAWEIVELIEGRIGLLKKVSSEDGDGQSQATNSINTTPDIGNKILQMLSGVKEDIEDMKGSIDETRKRYGELEHRLAVMESKLEEQEAKPSRRLDHVLEEVEHPERARKGWHPVEPDPKEPFCSANGGFLWIGGNPKRKTQQNQAPVTPTMITGGTTNNKFAILLENQVEITKQLRFFISQLRSVREVQDQQNELLDTVKQSNLNLVGLIRGVKEDIASVKLGVHGSLEQYNRLEGHLSGLEAPVSGRDTKLSLPFPEPSSEAELSSSNDVHAAASLEPTVESDGRKIFKPDPKAPFCALNGKFIWIGTDVE
jgi:hypothetical protein